MTMFIYLFKTIIISGLLYAYYLIFLRNKQFHQYNRFYLLSIPVISLLLPLFNIPFPGLSQSNPNAGLKILKVITINDWEPEVVITATTNWAHSIFNLQNILLAIYFIVSLLLFYLLMKSFFYIIRLSKKYKYEKIEGIKFFQTTENGTPFSFFKNIFWNHEIAMNTKKGEQVFRHELFHVKQKHTEDILLIEIITIVCWFNPFFHFIKKEIKVIHEFLADQYAASSTDKYDYSELLVFQSASTKQINITNYFFHNEIKRRIMMITKFKNPRYGYISRIMALPLLFIIFCAFAFKAGNKKINPIHSNKKITIVIDAGHGGVDNGVYTNAGFLEKNITLSLAKKIEALSKNYNVDVIMTRETDMLPGNATTIKDGLINRVNIAEKNNASMFISIHMDAAINNKPESGFSIYVSNKNSNYQKSIQLGSALTAEIKKTYSVSPDLKERQKGILVLQSPSMPALMIQCGYMTNKKDLNFIIDEKNQEQIAKDILEGVVKFADNANNNSAGLPDKNNSTTMLLMQRQNDFINDTSSKKIYSKVEVEAVFPGGQKGWSNYLMTHLKYPEEAQKKEIQGLVVAQFVVNTNGALSDIKIIKSPSKILSDETLRIIKNSGKWIPASNNGEIVKSYKRQPIHFVLAPK